MPVLVTPERPLIARLLVGRQQHHGKGRPRQGQFAQLQGRRLAFQLQIDPDQRADALGLGLGRPPALPGMQARQVRPGQLDPAIGMQRHEPGGPGLGCPPRAVRPGWQGLLAEARPEPGQQIQLTQVSARQGPDQRRLGAQVSVIGGGPLANEAPGLQAQRPPLFPATVMGPEDRDHRPHRSRIGHLHTAAVRQGLQRGGGAYQHGRPAARGEAERREALPFTAVRQAHLQAVGLFGDELAQFLEPCIGLANAAVQACGLGDRAGEEATEHQANPYPHDRLPAGHGQAAAGGRAEPAAAGSALEARRQLSALELLGVAGCLQLAAVQAGLASTLVAQVLALAGEQVQVASTTAAAVAAKVAAAIGAAAIERVFAHAEDRLQFIEADLAPIVRFATAQASDQGIADQERHRLGAGQAVVALCAALHGVGHAPLTDLAVATDTDEVALTGHEAGVDRGHQGRAPERFVAQPQALLGGQGGALLAHRQAVEDLHVAVHRVPGQQDEGGGAHEAEGQQAGALLPASGVRQWLGGGGSRCRGRFGGGHKQSMFKIEGRIRR